MVRSTELGDRLDPESIRRVVSRYFDVMRAVVERHGGTVEKFIGDAIMAVFGGRGRRGAASVRGERECRRRAQGAGSAG
jgi:class 3 adenylate cyclase